MEEEEHWCLLIPDTDPRRHDAVWRLGGGGRVPLRRGAVRGEVLVDESGQFTCSDALQFFNTENV